MTSWLNSSLTTSGVTQPRSQHKAFSASLYRPRDRSHIGVSGICQKFRENPEIYTVRRSKIVDLFILCCRSSDSSYLIVFTAVRVGRGSSVGIATELRAGRFGDRISVGAKLSTPVHTGPGAHPASCAMGTGFFPRVNSGRGVTLTPHPLLLPLVMNE